MAPRLSVPAWEYADQLQAGWIGLPVGVSRVGPTQGPCGQIRPADQMPPVRQAP